MIDGLWKQIFAETLVRYTIGENTEATKVAQLELTSDTALQALRYMYNNIDARAHEADGLAYQMTRSLWNNWKDYLEDKSLVFSLDVAEAGSSRQAYRGIPIVVRNDWDRNILAYNNLGATYLYPHRAILTSTANIPVGTSDEEV